MHNPVYLVDAHGVILLPFFMNMVFLFVDFGLVLGCKIYVRENARTDKDCAVQEGDVILKINNHTTEGLSLKEARKLIENSKEKLSLVVRRERRNGAPDTPNSMKGHLSDIQF